MLGVLGWHDVYNYAVLVVLISPITGTLQVTILRCVYKWYRYWMVEVLCLDEILANFQTKICVICKLQNKHDIFLTKLF